MLAERDTVERDGATTPEIRARMKGALEKVIAKARRDTSGRKRFPRASGYVSLAQTGFKKMFKTDVWWIEQPRLSVAEPTPAQTAQDPVALVSFAINTLAPASYRAAIFGKPVTVTVEDEATAEVLRAAIAASCSERPTNHLIQVRVRG